MNSLVKYLMVCPLFPLFSYEVTKNGKEWNANPKIQKFKQENQMVSNHDLQTYFNIQLIPMLKKHNKKLMGWEEIMTENMSKDAIIHAWRDKRRPSVGRFTC
jgi:hexosaminidase